MGNPQSTLLLSYRDTLLREGLVLILKEAGFQIVSQTGTAKSISRLAAQHSPEIILLEWDDPDIDGDVVKNVTSVNPHAAIVILTRPEPPETIVHAMHAGASGCLSVNMSKDEFVQSLQMLARGDVIVSKEMAKAIKQELSADHSQSAEVTDREQEVVQLVGQGATNKEIAQTLVVAENTVKVHLRRILNKLHLRNRQQVAAYAAQKGLINKPLTRDKA